MLENLVCSLEMGKKLKAAGWNKPTARLFGPPWKSDKELPLPNAEEILSDLPKAINGKCLFIRRFNNTWRVSYGLGECAEIEWGDECLTEAACEMWLWCKENNHIADAGKKGE